MIKIIYNFFAGIMMGFSDSVPGISGSTITYILGVYETFIYSLSNLFKKDSFLSSFKFLFNLGLGWIIGVISTILLLSSAIDNHIYPVSSLFLGFIIASIPVTFFESFGNFNVKKGKIIYTILGFSLVFLVFKIGNLSYLSFILSSKYMIYIYIFVVAMFAISSMLLPGISGSTVLLIFGLYYPLISTLNDILKGQTSNLKYIFVFVLGAIVGLFTISKLINNAFNKYRDNTIYFVEGMLIASVLPIIYAPNNLGLSSLSFNNFSMFSFLIGILFLFLLVFIKNKKRGYDE